MKIILASGSPRRYDLLRQMGWNVKVHSLPFAEVETIDDARVQLENLQKQFFLSGQGSHIFSEQDVALLSQYKNADLVCAFNALGKGKATALETGTETPVVSADTIVVLDNIILGKPADAADAKRMLSMLSGRTHQVKTAAAVRYLNKTLLQVITTEVHFRTLTEPEIEWYAGTGEPMDKAGAYGIQGKGAVLVEKIEGSYDNVVGLPLTTVYEMFIRMGALLPGE